MEKVKHVLYAVSEPSLLESKRGEKVWPVRAENLEEFKKFTSRFSFSLLEIPRQETVRGCLEVVPSDWGGVVSLDRCSEEMARLYAYLTGRNYLGLYDSSLRTGIEVLVGLHSSIATSLLGSLSLMNRAGFPGIIFADTIDDLSREVVFKSASVQNSRQDPLPLRMYLPSRVGENLELDFFSILFEGSSDSKVDTFLNDVESVKVFETHSDGLDIKIASRVVCPISTFKGSSDQEMPNCLAYNFCYRRNLPLPQFLSSKDLVEADKMRGYVSVLGVCYGLVTKEHRIPFRWSIAGQVARNFASLITTWEITFWNPALLQYLGCLLAAGGTVGDAMDHFLRNVPKDPWYLRFVLLGDPRFSAVDLQDLEIFRSLIPRPDFEDESVFGGTAVDGDLESIDLVNRRFLKQNNFLDRISHNLSAVSNIWFEFMYKRGSIRWSIVECPNCYCTEAKKCKFDIRSLKRTVVLCPNCGTVEDSSPLIDIQTNWFEDKVEIEVRSSTDIKFMRLISRDGRENSRKMLDVDPVSRSIDFASIAFNKSSYVISLVVADNVDFSIYTFQVDGPVLSHYSTHEVIETVLETLQ